MEESEEFINILLEQTEEAFLIATLSLGNYRLRITSFDILGRLAQRSDWVHFSVIPPENPGWDPQLVMGIIPPSDWLFGGLPENNRSFYIGLIAEGAGYTRFYNAFGGGITFGGCFNRVGAGLNLLYALDGEGLTFFEAAVHFRYYFFRERINSGLFAQAEGGIVMFTHELFDAFHFVPAIGLRVGWRFLLGSRFFVEPNARGGYPYIWGAGLSAGVRF